MNILKFIGKWILNIISVISILVIIIALSFAFQILIQHKPYGDLFGYTAFNIKTGSMAPTINIGDGVLVKLDSELKEGDIIIYQDKDSLVCHRLININGNTLTTKGDSNNANDEPITKDKAVGKVIKIMPTFGQIQQIIRNPYVIVGLIDVIIIGNVVYYYFNRKKKE